MIIPMLCVTIFVILVVWFLLPRVARLMIHTPTAISIFVCLSMVQLMAVFISMRCTLCGHFLQVALTLILVVGYAIVVFSSRRRHTRLQGDWSSDVCSSDLKLKQNCDITDQPAAALIKDLKQRGLLDSTLVVWGGEFGRTPMSEIRKPEDAASAGRDHHPVAYSMWMAGGGIKCGQVVGKTDDLCFHITEDPIHVHDLQATILNCLGMDHTRLTFRYMGREFRLTDVAGNVVRKLLV